MRVSWQHITELMKKYNDTRLEHWLHDSFLSFNWWVLVITTVGLLLTWLLIVDKKRIMEIVAYGLLVTAIGVFGDTVGLAFSLWDYRDSLMPTPPINEIHNIQMPVLYMIMYQYFRTWKSFLIAAAVNALIFAFILERILAWLQIYEQYHWKHIYSVIPYFLIAVVFKWLIQKFKQQDQHYQQ